MLPAIVVSLLAPASLTLQIGTVVFEVYSTASEDWRPMAVMPKHMDLDLSQYNLNDFVVLSHRCHFDTDHYYSALGRVACWVCFFRVIRSLVVASSFRVVAAVRAISTCVEAEVGFLAVVGYIVDGFVGAAANPSVHYPVAFVVVGHAGPKSSSAVV